MEFELPYILKKLQDGTYSQLFTRGAYVGSQRYRMRDNTLYIATYVNGFCITSIGSDETKTERELSIQDLYMIMVQIAPMKEWIGVK